MPESIGPWCIQAIVSPCWAYPKISWQRMPIFVTITNRSGTSAACFLTHILCEPFAPGRNFHRFFHVLLFRHKRCDCLTPFTPQNGD
jgi:hypothetical protein